MQRFWTQSRSSIQTNKVNALCFQHHLVDHGLSLCIWWQLSSTRSRSFLRFDAHALWVEQPTIVWKDTIPIGIFAIRDFEFTMSERCFSASWGRTMQGKFRYSVQPYLCNDRELGGKRSCKMLLGRAQDCGPISLRNGNPQASSWQSLNSISKQPVYFGKQIIAWLQNANV